jgi:hypothetical protein
LSAVGTAKFSTNSRTFIPTDDTAIDPTVDATFHSTELPAIRATYFAPNLSAIRAAKPPAVWTAFLSAVVTTFDAA